MNNSLEKMHIYDGYVNIFRRAIKSIVISSFFDNMIMICVIINTIILSLDGLVKTEDEHILNQFNLSFTIIFAIDMFLKLVGLGIV